MNLSATPMPDFLDPAFLRAHIADCMAFYHPRAIDPAGGFFHYFRDDGSLYESGHRHLVSSTRFVFNYAMAAREFADDACAGDYLAAVEHGLRYLREAHREATSGAYVWTLREGRPEDHTRHAYGIAFVLLAYASARKAGVDTAAWMNETWALLEERYWDPAAGLYRDEADRDWIFSGYRGQNANMHLCEALIAAFEASAEIRYLDRALLLADRMTRRQAALAGGLVWEHYDRDWNVDWNYNRDNPRHLFRPWGFQPGHQVEWAKLLVLLHGHFAARGTPPDWLLARACHLFDSALDHAWDEQHEGIVYGFAPDFSICDDDKYFWVQAETIAAAARLFAATGDARYREWYERVWRYAWRFFVDHEHGAWYRILDRRNRKYSDEKSPAGKTDYHTMGACHEVLAVLRAGAGFR